MLVSFTLKVTEIKVPIPGELEHSPIVSGVDLAVNCEIKAEEMKEYASVVTEQMKALSALFSAQQIPA